MLPNISRAFFSRTYSWSKSAFGRSLFVGFLNAVALTHACAQVPIKVFNTGVDDNGVLLAYGAVERHYVLLSTPVSMTPATPYVTSHIPYWANPDPLHVNWISPDADAFQPYPAGNYVWRITFDLTGLDPTTAVLNGGWSVDNQGKDILINGHSTGYATPNGSGSNASYSSFTINKYFQSGLNTLDFVAYNNTGTGTNPTGINIRLSGTAKPPPSALVSGSVILQDIVAYAPAQNVTFVFRPVNGGGDITKSVSVAPTGAFSLPNIPFNTYLLHIKSDKYLAANVNVDAQSGDVTGLTVFLPAGDANNDNVVDIADFGLLVGAYGSKANDQTSGYDLHADLNGDGVADILDFSLLVANYLQSGDN